MRCIPLDGVALSPGSKKTLKEIADKLKFGKMLKPILAGGTLFNALASDKAIPAMFNVTSTDWSTLLQSMKSVNTIVKRSVQTEIEMKILSTSGKENMFWKNMYDCF